MIVEDCGCILVHLWSKESLRAIGRLHLVLAILGNLGWDFLELNLFVKLVDLLLIEYNLLYSFLKSYHLEMHEHIICQLRKMSWAWYLLKVRLVRLSSSTILFLLFHFRSTLLMLLNLIQNTTDWFWILSMNETCTTILLAEYFHLKWSL